MSGRRLTTIGVALAMAALVAGTVDAETEGEVVSVRGDLIHVAVTGGTAPAIGDTVTVMNRSDEDGNATAIGRWRVIELLGGDEVTAIREASYGLPPEVGMRAVILVVRARRRGSRRGELRRAGKGHRGSRPGGHSPARS